MMLVPFATMFNKVNCIVAEELKGTDIMVGAAIGFPFGQQSSAVKAFETEEAVKKGATV